MKFWKHMTNNKSKYAIILSFLYYLAYIPSTMAAPNWNCNSVTYSQPTAASFPPGLFCYKGENCVGLKPGCKIYHEKAGDFMTGLGGIGTTPAKKYCFFVIACNQAYIRNDGQKVGLHPPACMTAIVKPDDSITYGLEISGTQQLAGSWAIYHQLVCVNTKESASGDKCGWIHSNATINPYNLQLPQHTMDAVNKYQGWTCPGGQKGP